MYIGEIISLGVAVSWTATALFAEVASKRMGSLPLNVVRMALSLLFLGLSLWLTIGVPYPLLADGYAWLWLSLSGFVGYSLGDYCLFQSYVYMNSRFGQLFMTIASPAAAVTAWATLGENMQPLSILGMIITTTGICMSILSKGSDGHKLALKLPLKGVLFGLGAGLGQGVGLVFSKIGMQYYEASILQSGISDMYSWVNADAFIPVSLGFMMPFASTMIRAVTGMAGFTFALFLLARRGGERLNRAVHDRKAMWCAIGAAVFGPFVGVSLSLMATLYTSAGIAQTLMALTPVLIILPSHLLFHQKVSWMEVVGAIVSVCGVVLFFM